MSMLRPAEVREKFGMLPLVLDALRKTNSCVLLRLVNAGSNPKILRSPLKWPFELECIDFLLYSDGQLLRTNFGKKFVKKTQGETT